MSMRVVIVTPGPAGAREVVGQALDNVLGRLEAGEELSEEAASSTTAPAASTH
jgi:hypothetical protein